MDPADTGGSRELSAVTWGVLPHVGLEMSPWNLQCVAEDPLTPPADGGDPPSRRAAGFGHGWHLRPVRQGVPAP